MLVVLDWIHCIKEQWNSDVRLQTRQQGCLTGCPECSPSMTNTPTTLDRCVIAPSSRASRFVAHLNFFVGSLPAPGLHSPSNVNDTLLQRPAHSYPSADRDNFIIFPT